MMSISFVIAMMALFKDMMPKDINGLMMMTWHRSIMVELLHRIFLKQKQML